MRDLKIFTPCVDAQALHQINELMEQEAFAGAKVRIMPDVHAGTGCVIGFTANLSDKVVPNLVGADIGCGVIIAPLGNVEIDLEKLDNFIKTKMCYGLNVNEKVLVNFNLSKLRCYNYLTNIGLLEKAMGSLGSGNHFIEVDMSDNGDKFLLIHTGSRNLGLQVASIYQKLAIKLRKSAGSEEKEEITKLLKSQGKQAQIPEEIEKIVKKYEKETKLTPDLCYLDKKEREDYLFDMFICQDWAKANRRLMVKQIITHLQREQKIKFKTNPEKAIFEVVHNYIGEDNIIRKGAISAKKGEKVLIPLNMRDGCILGVGKGNEDWNCSAPHGAGRLLSRGAAKFAVSMEEYRKSMEGIYTTSVTEGTLDESPAVYKPMEQIVELIGDTVEIKQIIKPIYNFKAEG